MKQNRKEKGNVPNLRFPEFEEEWGWYKLEEVATISKGSGISKEQLSETGRPCILYGELYTKYKSVVIQEILSCTNITSKNLIKSQANDVIIPSSGETSIDIATARCVPFVDILLGGDLNIIRLFRDNGAFLSYQLNQSRKYDIAKIAQGVSVVHLYGDKLKKLNIAICSIEEQNKIVKFLSLLEERIETQNKIIEDLKLLKDTISKKIFSCQLIFKDDNGDRFPKWENMKLGDIGEVKMCKRIFNDETSPTGEIPFFKIGSFGKEADAFISKKLYSNYRNRFSFPKKGDILISAAGTIGRTVVYKGEDAYYQDSNIVWVDNDNTKVTNEFLYYILQIVKYNTEGGTIQRLYNNILKSTKFNCPSLLEQTKIADFLSSIDTKTILENELLLRLEKQKKFFLQQMFV